MANTQRADNGIADTIVPAPAPHKTRPETVSHAKPKAPKKAKPSAADQVAKMRQASLDVAPQPAPVELVMMPVSLIDCAAQVRTLFDDESLAELAADVACRGVLQPVLLRPIEGGRYLIIAGERRLRACVLAQLPTIPAIVGQIDDETAEDMQLAENIQREELNLKDTAAAVKRLYQKLGSVQAVADYCHKSKGWISKHLSIADGLNSYASRLLADGVTEDLETLKAVSALEALTPGTNSAWALCEKIRAGKAGRTAAREALAEAKDAADPVKRAERQREKDMQSKAREESAHQQAKTPSHPSAAYWQMVKDQAHTWYGHQASGLFRISRYIPIDELAVDQFAASYEDCKRQIEEHQATVKHLSSEMERLAAEHAAGIRKHCSKFIFEAAYDAAQDAMKSGKS